MDAVGLADLLQKYGPWGLIAVLMFVVWKLYEDNKTCAATALADRDKLILAQQAAAVAAEKCVSALEGIRITLMTHKDASEDLTKQVELAAQETRHAFANMRQSLEGIAGRLERDGTRGRP